MYNKERKKQYDIDYAKKNLKRIPLNVRFDKYDEWTIVNKVDRKSTVK